MEHSVKIYSDPQSWVKTLFFIVFGTAVGLFFYRSAYSMEAYILEEWTLGANVFVSQLVYYTCLMIGLLFAAVPIWWAVYLRIYTIAFTEDKISLRQAFWLHTFRREDVVDVKYDDEKRRLLFQLQETASQKQKRRAWVDLSLIGLDRREPVQAQIETWVAATSQS